VRRADLLPVNQGKAERTHALAAAYGLLQPSLVRLVAPKEATVQQLTEFHDADYLERLTDSKPQPKKQPEKRNIFGMKMGRGNAHPP
jgi:acetoin utilization deacetylase AcuC-like enzyme